MTGYKIPHFSLGRQYSNLRPELIDATDKTLASGNWIDGPNTAAFEDWLSKRCKTKYAVVTHSGTQALEIIAKYYSSEIQSINKITNSLKATVWVPNLTYPATMNAFINSNWEVVLGEVDSNGIMKLEEIPALNYQCVVGLYGAPPSTKFKSDGTTGMTFVDGAQHWLVAEGNVGLGMAISFDPTKNLPSSGNGGAIVTNSLGLADFAIDYTRHGKHNEHRYAGTNSKMSELECAHMLVRVKYINQWQERRKDIRNYWIDRFASLPVRCLSAGHEKHSDQKFVIYTEDRDQLYIHLQDSGIECKKHYGATLAELPVAKKATNHNFISPGMLSPGMLSTSYMLSRGVLSLPIYPELTDDEVEQISTRVINFYSK